MEQAPPIGRRNPRIINIASLRPVPGANFQKLKGSVRFLWMIGPFILWAIIFTVLTVLVIADRFNAFDGEDGSSKVSTFLLPIGGVLAVLALWHLLWPLISYSHWGYAIRSNDLLIRSGVIWKRIVAVPFSRIQHVDSAAGPIERMFGVARVDIHTAGTAMSKISIPGLEAERAESLRDHLSKVGHSHANI